MTCAGVRPDARNSAVPYLLKYATDAEAVHDALPAEASSQLTNLLADVCEDPLGHSIPYGEDDPYVRMIITDHAFAVILIGHVMKTVTVLQISYMG
jgi:hypothetical protein